MTRTPIKVMLSAAAATALMLAGCSAGDDAENTPSEEGSAEETLGGTDEDAAVEAGEGPQGLDAEQLTAILSEVTIDGEALTEISEEELSGASELTEGLNIQPEECQQLVSNNGAISAEDHTLVAGAAGLDTLSLVGDATEDQLSEIANRDLDVCSEFSMEMAGTTITASATDLGEEVAGADATTAMQVDSEVSGTETTTYTVVATTGSVIVSVNVSTPGKGIDVAISAAEQAVAAAQNQS